MRKKDLKKESGGGELEEEKEISEDESTRGVIVEENEPTEDEPYQQRHRLQYRR